MKGKKKTLEKKLKYKKITKKKNLQEKGITLIALVVTIIILLILAGVTLNIALSDNGLFSKAKKAADDYNQKSIEEELQILFAEKQLDNYSNGSSVKTDVTELLEEMIGGKEITQDDINNFNKYLEGYGEEVKAITSKEDLEKIGQEEGYSLDGIYVQLSDISLDSDFTPIGIESAPFTGVYNGNGKKISSLTITATSDNAGMFGVSEGTIKNVTVESCTITTTTYSKIGAIAGTNSGLIENCTVSGTVGSGEDENSEIGGICGYNYGGNIENCTNSASVSGKNNVGGIVGYSYKSASNRDTDITRCDNTGTVTGYSSCIGGICGLNEGGNIYKSSNSGHVSLTGNDAYYGVAGIAGKSSSEQYSSKIEYCYNVGKISFELNEEVDYGEGRRLAAGIVGIGEYNKDGKNLNIKLEINNCYNQGEIACTGKGTTWGPAGIICWGRYVDISNCYNTGKLTCDIEDFKDDILRPSGILLMGRYCNLKNDYWLDTCGAFKGGDDADGNNNTLIKVSEKNDGEMKNLAGELGDAFVTNEGGYPKLSWE